MKRIVCALVFAMAAAGPVLAADLPPAPPPPHAPAAYIPAPVPVFSWTGFYLGVNGGYAWSQSTINGTLPTTGAAAAAGFPGANVSTGTFNGNGGLFGGTIGGNYQFNALVVGVEGDMDWVGLKGNASNNGLLLNGVNTGVTCVGCAVKETALGTFRGRIGVAFDRILVYGTGGGATATCRPGPQRAATRALGSRAGPPARASRARCRRTGRRSSSTSTSTSTPRPAIPIAT